VNLTEGSARPCPGCSAAPGALHAEECNVALCAMTGRQRSASCVTFGEITHPQDRDCRTVWTGRWPGDAECEEYGFYAYPRWRFDGGNGWASCGPDHPGAETDLNRLALECVWSELLQRFVKPSAGEGEA
jgi:hypothetical protein